jgi:hypothetical protein
MIYATSLGNGLILALAFDAETPFSKIRSQASQLARELAVPPSVAVKAPTSETIQQPVAEVRQPVIRHSTLTPRKSVGDIPDLSENWLKIDNLAKELFTEEDDADIEAEPAPPAAPQETRPSEKTRITTPARTAPIAHPTPRIVMEPVLPGMVSLVYACVIIPRLPQHHLNGDVVERLM